MIRDLHRYSDTTLWKLEERRTAWRYRMTVRHNKLCVANAYRRETTINVKLFIVLWVAFKVTTLWQDRNIHIVAVVTKFNIMRDFVNSTIKFSII